MEKDFWVPRINSGFHGSLCVKHELWICDIQRRKPVAEGTSCATPNTSS